MSEPKKVIPFPRPGARAWKAAEQSEILSGWITAARPPDVDIRLALRPLRARSREQAQNNDLMRAFLTELKTNIVGAQGIRLQGRARMVNGKPNKRINDAVEQAWKRWARRGSCDVTGQLSFRDLCNLATETAGKDGEFFIRKVTPWDNEAGFALQMVDAEAVDVGFDKDLDADQRIVMGVQLDQWRRPVTYYLTDEPSNPYMQTYALHNKRKPVPAAEIIHGYLPEWCWQTRGVPWAASGLWRLKMLGGYEEAAVTGARVAASKMGFYSLDPEAAAQQQLEGVRTDAGTLVKEAEPGTMEELPPGYSVNTVDWGWPNADHGSFMKPVMRNIAAGLGVSYPSWGRDLEGVNYSSLRHGALAERDIWRGLQRWLIEWLLQPVYDAWLPAAVMSGAIKANGRPISQDISVLREVSWQPRGWQWVDPLKEGQAAEQAVRLRTRSISSFIRERGDDPEEVWEEMAADRDKLIALGIEPEMSAAQDPAAPAEDEDEDEDEDADAMDGR